MMEGSEFGERAAGENVALAAALAQRLLEALRIGADVAAELTGMLPRDIPEEERPAHFMASALIYLLPIEGISVPEVDGTDEPRNASLAARFSAQTGMDISLENVRDAYRTVCANYDRTHDVLFRDILAAELEAAQNLAAERGILPHEVIADDELYMHLQRETTRVDQSVEMTAATVKKIEKQSMLMTITEYGSAVEAALRHMPEPKRQVEVVEWLRNDPQFQHLMAARADLSGEVVRQVTIYNIVKFLGQAGLDQLTDADKKSIGYGTPCIVAHGRCLRQSTVGKPRVTKIKSAGREAKCWF